MSAEKNKIHTGHADLDSASHETLNQVQGDKRKDIKSLNKNIQIFIGDMGQTTNEIRTDFTKIKLKNSFKSIFSMCLCV